MTLAAEVLDLVRRWAAAEEDNDAGRLDRLLADDFVGVGPVGYVLSRDLWLGRFRKGLANHAFAVEDPQVNTYDGAAVVVAVLAQQTSVKDRDNSGRFRLSLTAVRAQDGWRVAGAHIGPLEYPAAQRSS
jgi:ketosteroid isomerase-like protein